MQDFDSPWKEALHLYFRAFLALLFPEVHAQIDWSRDPEWLDKEFQQIIREAELGRRTVDKLVRVWTLDGVERWVLIHIEIQSTRDSDFELRMYVYNYRIFDRYNRQVASLAVLADEDPGWRPSEFRNSLFGCETGIRFPVAKLLDVAQDVEALEASTNPIAKVILAHRKAQQTRDNPGERQTWKIRLVRGLYERGFGAKDVRELFRLMDWMMELPEEMTVSFWHEIEGIQQERQMPFITTPERVGRLRGLCVGIETVLEIRFGEAGLQLMPQIREICDEDQLCAILKAMRTPGTLEEVSRLCSPKTS